MRELENAIERAVIMSTTSRIDEADLPFSTAPVGAAGGLHVPGATMAEVERYVITKTLEACAGSTTKAAEMLGISVRTIQYRMHSYGLRSESRHAGLA